MKKILLGAAALLIATGVAMPQAAHAVRSQTRSYVAAGGDAVQIDDANDVNSALPAVGGGTFLFQGAETSVTITVADTVAKGNIAFYWEYAGLDEAGTDVCGSTATIPKVTGATGVTVWIDQAFIALACSPTKQQPGTTGTITAKFTP